MTKCRGELLDSSLILLYTKTSKEPLKDIILKNYDAFFKYISTLKISVSHKSKTYNFQNTSTTKLILPTTCFKVDFNDSFVKITAIIN